MKTMLLSILVLLVQAASVPPVERTNEYVVGAQDVLSIVIHNWDDLSRREGAAVETDGTIDYPLIGRIKVGGLTTRQIQELIKQKFVAGGYLTTPTVTVTVKEYRSQSVYVFGAVRNPGLVQLTGVGTLTEALNKAGSFTERAGQEVIIAHNGTAGSPAVLSEVKPEDKQVIAREAIEMGKANGVLLRDGDTIFVPDAPVYYVSGQVQKPGEYVYKPRLRVIQAITIAGGYSERAAKGRLEVERAVNGKLKKSRIKESDIVQPGDTIRVPTRIW